MEAPKEALRAKALSVLVLLLFFVPSFFISGLLVPIDPESARAQLMSVALPATHYVTISRGIFLKGVGLEVLWPQALALLAWGLTILGLATLRSTKRAA